MSEQRISEQRTREQRRADKAWQAVRWAKDQGGDIEKKYNTLARKLSALIQVNGLGQTLAFVYAKAKMAEPSEKRGAEAQANEALYNDISGWLKKLSDFKLSSDDDLLQAVIERSSDFYRRATTEVLSFSLWLGRFAEAELKTEEEGREE